MKKIPINEFESLLNKSEGNPVCDLRVLNARFGFKIGFTTIFSYLLIPSKLLLDDKFMLTVCGVPNQNWSIGDCLFFNGIVEIDESDGDTIFIKQDLGGLKWKEKLAKEQIIDGGEEYPSIENFKKTHSLNNDDEYLCFRIGNCFSLMFYSERKYNLEINTLCCISRDLHNVYF